LGLKLIFREVDEVSLPYMNKAAAIRPPGFSPNICIRFLSTRSQTFRQHTSKTSDVFLRSNQSSYPDPCKLARHSHISALAPGISVDRRYISTAVATVENDSLLSSQVSLAEATADPDALEKMTVKDLRALLTERGLKVSGLKAELIERLREASQEHGGVSHELKNEQIPVSEGTTDSPPLDSTMSLENLGPSTAEPQSKDQPLPLDSSIQNLELAISNIQNSLAAVRLSASQIRDDPFASEMDKAAKDMNPIAAVEHELKRVDIRTRLIFADLFNHPFTIKTAEIMILANEKIRPLNIKSVSRDLLRAEFLSNNMLLNILRTFKPETLPDKKRRKANLKTAESFFGRALREARRKGLKATRGMDLTKIKAKHKKAFLKVFYMPLVRKLADIKVNIEEDEMREIWERSLEGFERNIGNLYKPRPPTPPAPPKSSSNKNKNKKQLLRKKFIELASKPVDIGVTITPRHWQAFIDSVKSQSIDSGKVDPNERLNEILKPMWERMQLTEHIKGVRQGGDKHDLIVTFDSFPAAASFVNRCNEHWLLDEFSGQVYASWLSDNNDKRSVTAILIFPKATLEVWRRIASEDGVPTSKWGFPLIHWGNSLTTVFERMHLSFGRDGQVRRYRFLAEYPHRMILDVSFSDVGTLNNFLARKGEHYVTNPWKDRFFAKRLTWVGYAPQPSIADCRLRPEWMPVPSEKRPVPNADELSARAAAKCMGQNFVEEARRKTEDFVDERYQAVL
jgi:hypothetical protein